ncbi:MAG: hypothetical protein LBR79_04600 [Oscillospiraceae bacterium]|nr:hypothetical protein [Oscillospiraceae bacterium]
MQSTRGITAGLRASEGSTLAKIGHVSKQLKFLLFPPPAVGGGEKYYQPIWATT